MENKKNENTREYEVPPHFSKDRNKNVNGRHRNNSWYVISHKKTNQKRLILTDLKRTDFSGFSYEGLKRPDISGFSYEGLKRPILAGKTFRQTKGSSAAN